MKFALRLILYFIRLRTRLELAVLRKKHGVKIDPSFKMGEGSSINARDGHGKLVIGRHVATRRNFSLLIYPGASCTIGDNVFFNSYCSVNCLDEIEIGSNTMFGESVKFYDHNHAFDRGATIAIDRDKFRKAKITVGNNCWIGSNVTILMGVTIGDNVVIGANCLIRKSIPANSVVKQLGELSVETAGI